MCPDSKKSAEVPPVTLPQSLSLKVFKTKEIERINGPHKMAGQPGPKRFEQMRFTQALDDIPIHSPS